MTKCMDAPEVERFIIIAEHLEGGDTIHGPFLASGMCATLQEWANNPHDTRLLRVFPVGVQIGYYNKQYRRADGETIE